MCCKGFGFDSNMFGILIKYLALTTCFLTCWEPKGRITWIIYALLAEVMRYVKIHLLNDEDLIHWNCLQKSVASCAVVFCSEAKGCTMWIMPFWLQLQYTWKIFFLNVEDLTPWMTKTLNAWWISINLILDLILILFGIVHCTLYIVTWLWRC